MTPDTAAADAGERVLIYAPIGRDAELTYDLLKRSGVDSVVCPSLAALCDAFEAGGGGVLVITEETLDDPNLMHLVEALDRQPPWSEVPVLLFAGSAGSEMSLRTIRSIETLRNVTLLERPIRIAAVLTSIRAALRGRARQYEVRDLLVALHRARTEAEGANRLKDEFLATLSHELRTPLNAIIGWTSMLTNNQIESHLMPRIFEALDRNAHAQAQLITDVLDVSRIITGKLQLDVSTVDVGLVLARSLDTVRPAAVAKGIALKVLEEPDCMVRGDPDRLQQVFWNLLSNAVKFTPQGGSVHVETTRHDGSVWVEIRDTGQGIDPEFVPFVFDRFRQADQTTTRSHGGLGLGLAIVKHIAELHGGTVTAASDGLEKGACFTVALPATDRPGEAVRAHREPGGGFNVSLAGRSILVVDDDAATRDVMAAVLEGAHARVGLADSAASGWTCLIEHVPDLIVADLGMPNEDGLSFIQRVRESGDGIAKLPAIALSAYADARTQSAAKAAGFSAFVAKPARPQALLELIESLLEGQRANCRGQI